MTMSQDVVSRFVLQTSPRDDALALLLAFGSANTWHGDFHPVSSVPCLAHTHR
jgi:hypothetical protein